MLHQWMNDSTMFGLNANWMSLERVISNGYIRSGWIAIMLVGFKLFDMITQKLTW